MNVLEKIQGILSRNTSPDVVIDGMQAERKERIKNETILLSN